MRTAGAAAVFIVLIHPPLISAVEIILAPIVQEGDSPQSRVYSADELSERLIQSVILLDTSGDLKLRLGGRLVSRRDESGSISYRCGLMGEVTYEQRSLERLTPLEPERSAAMRYPPSVRIHVAPIELESMRGRRGMIHEKPREGNWFNS